MESELDTVRAWPMLWLIIVGPVPWLSGARWVCFELDGVLVAADDATAWFAEGLRLLEGLRGVGGSEKMPRPRIAGHNVTLRSGQGAKWKQAASHRKLNAGEIQGLRKRQHRRT